VKHVRSIISTLICASVCVMGTFAQAQQQAASQPRQKNLLVGVVDVRDCLSVHPFNDEIQALQKKLQLEGVEYAKAQQEAQDAMLKLQQEFKVGTPEYEQQMSAIRQKLADAQLKAQSAQDKLVVERTQCLFKAYKDLQAAIKAVAVQNGVVIVHSKVKITVPEGANVSEEEIALQEADANLVLWNRPECDLTSQVKQLLSAKAPATNNSAASSPLANLGGQAMNAGAAANSPTAANAAPRTASTQAAAQRR